MTVELTERFLMSAGGWKAFGEAKRIQRAGAVLEASYDPPLLRGQIRQGERVFLAGLKILRRTEMENLCPCRESRLEGRICAHSLAIGLEVLHPTAEKSPARQSEPRQEAPAPRDFRPTSEIPRVEASFEGSTQNLEATVRFDYSEKGVRNVAAEEAALGELEAAGFRQRPGKPWLLSGEEKVLSFYAGRLGDLQRRWSVTVGERFERVTDDVTKIEPKFAIQPTGGGWFQLRFHFQAGREALLSPDQVRSLLQSGKQTLDLGSGTKAVLDTSLLTDLEEVLRDVDPEQEAGGYRIRDMHRGYVNECIRDWTGGGAGEEGARPKLGSVGSILRPYQRDGAEWLVRQARSGRGGILADDMGLGKTVQALALVEAVGGPALVVCPSSLVWNWTSEAHEFLPEMPVTAVVGRDRKEKLRQGLESQGLLVTSYALLQRDTALYRDARFSIGILDEAQHIKNPDTQNARNARKLNARSRFVLTGTPVENSLRDLWSLFEFIQPGYLGDRKDFQERYELPLTAKMAQNPQAYQRLRRRIAPYFLRRTKREHLTELPEKVTQPISLELSKQEKTIYNQLMDAAREKIDAARAGGDKVTRAAAFTSLLRLRQACCDLRLLGIEAVERPTKLAALLELLEEAVDGGHRVLVFSQFTSLLDLVQDELVQDELGFQRLDGSTRDRQAVVEAFQNGTDPVFLLSLKAGGTGLNLTAADTVIHYDPWWNPAAEEQASDRVHRIGQTRSVNIYKLVARGTVEERIVNLQESKRALMEQVVGEGASLSMDELEALLS